MKYKFMKKTIIIIWIILWFLLINIFSINSYYNNFKWKEFYENKNFSWALELFEKEKNSIWLYNLWNINYKMWEKVPAPKMKKLNSGTGTKIYYWEKSVDFYKNSLKLKYDPRTEYNYNFVLDKLKKLKKKLEEEKKKENQDKKVPVPKDKKWNSGTGTTDKSAGQQGSSAPWKSEWEEKGWTQGSPLQDNKWKSEPQLSKEAKEQIKAYEEKLKQDQKKNAWNFWKVYQENNRNDIFDNFNSFFEDDPFFNNSLLNNNNEKKDW